MTTTHTQVSGTETASGYNRILFAAACLAGFTDLVHIVGGGADNVDPLMSSTLADTPRLTLLAVWYMATLAMGLSAAAFFIASRPQRTAAHRSLILFVSAMWIGFGLCFVWVAVFEGGNLLTELNQPILLIPVGLLGLWGVNKPTTHK